MLTMRTTTFVGTVMATVLVAVGAVTTAAQAVPGPVTATVTSAPTLPADFFRYADAYCPAGTNVIGGGPAVIGDAAAHHAVHLDVMVPWTTTGLQGSAKEHQTNFAGTWSVRVTAICRAVTGWQTVQTDVDIPAGDLSGTATATCPGTKKIIGAGGGTFKNPSFKLSSITVSNDLKSVTVKTLSPLPAAFEHHLGAIAICIDPLPGQQLVTATSPTNTSDKTLTVPCPPGTKVHGVSGGLLGTGGLAHLTRLDNYGQSRTNSAILQASNSDTLPLVQGWTAFVQAICAAT